MSSYGFKVLVDVDDVLLPCHERVCALGSEVAGYFVDPETTPHKIEEVIGEELGKKVWGIIDSIPGWCSQPGLTAEVQEGLLRLRSLADEVVAVTSPHTTGTWMQDRQAWLYEAGFKKDDIIQSSGKYHVPGDLLIDDLMSNHKKWRARWKDGCSVLVTATHNRKQTDLLPKMVRASNWDEIIGATIAAKLAWRRNFEARIHG